MSAYHLNEERESTITEVIGSSTMLHYTLYSEPSPTSLERSMAGMLHRPYSILSYPERLQLLRDAERMNAGEGQSRDRQLVSMLDNLRMEQDANLAARIVDVILALAEMEPVTKEESWKDFVRFISDRDGHAPAVVHLLSRIGQGTVQVPSGVEADILSIAAMLTASTDFSVRVAALGTFGSLHSEKAVVLDQARLKPHDLMVLFVADQEPRVRLAAVESLLRSHKRGHLLDLSIYPSIIALLRDDFEEVRMSAVVAVWTLAQCHNDQSIQNKKGVQTPLTDDAFIHLCDMVNDISMNVRLKAFRLLGSLHTVSYALLEQTLDKKLMSQFSMRKSMHEKQKELYGTRSSSTWNTGSKWGESKPVIDTISSDSEFSLMSSGACGAFVHGLEDEFMEVRSAAIDAMCELAQNNSAFAEVAADFLVDMFNDEIDSVRLSSVRALLKLSRYLNLRADQLDTILNSLSDTTLEIRTSLHDLLASSSLDSPACLLAVFAALLDNISKYPQDKLSVWRCCMDLGAHQATQVALLLPELIAMHPFYAVPEPNVTDPQYIAAAVLVFNAAAKRPEIIAALPQCIQRHQEYLRVSYPQLVCCGPNNSLSVSPVTTPGSEKTDALAQVSSYMDRVVASLNVHHHQDQAALVQLVQSLCDELGQLYSHCGNMSATVHFYHDILRGTLVLLRQLVGSRAGGLSSCRHLDMSTVQRCLSLLEISYSLGCLYSGFSSSEKQIIGYFRVWVSAYLLLHQGAFSSAEAVSSLEHRLIAINLSELPLHLSGPLTQLNSWVRLAVRTAIPEGLLAELLAVLPPLPCAVSRSIRRVSARIHSPGTNSDCPIKFSAGLSCSIVVDTTLENISDIDKVYIQVLWPDLSQLVVKPRPGDFKPSGDIACYHLVTSLSLTANQWAESSYIELVVAVSFDQDVDEVRFRHMILEAGGCSAHARTSLGQRLVSGLLPLCDPVRIYLQPKHSAK